MTISEFDRQNVSSDAADDNVRLAPRRSFLKVLGGVTIGALAAVTGAGSRQADVQATHNPPTSTALHDGENPVDSVMITNRIYPQDESRAVLDVGRGYDSENTYRNMVDSDDSMPAIRGIRGDAWESSSEETAAVVGHHLGNGTGVLGTSAEGTGIRGEGRTTGVHGSGKIGVNGTGDVGIVGRAGVNGIGIVGLGRQDTNGAYYNDDDQIPIEIHYSLGDGNAFVTNPQVDGVGVRAIGGTAVEGIADRETGVGVLGANVANGGHGVMGHALNGTGVIGVGAIGLHGIAIDGNGNLVGEGIVGEGKTGVVGKSLEPDGVGVQGQSDGGVGVQGDSANSDGIRGTSQTGDGVRGKSENAQGHGVLGENLQGEGVHGNGKTGVRGKSEDEDGEGVRGEGKTGVRGRSDKAQGKGIHGEADDDDGVGVQGNNGRGDAVRGEGKTGVRGKSGDAQGQGVRGENPNGEGMRGEGKTGVHGKSEDAQGNGVRGENVNGDAVRGEGKTGVRGKSVQADGTGVTGENDNGVGIEGRGRVGVRGVANGQGGGNPNAATHSLASTSSTLLNTSLPEQPIAIQGIAIGPGATGIQGGASDGATALKIETTTIDSVGLSITVPEGGTAVHIRGAACFDTVGMGQFAANSRSATIADSRVTEHSFVYAMLTGDPGRGNGTDMVAVQWVERSQGTGFTVHLNSKVKQATPFSYFIVEPCPPDEEADHSHS